LEAFVSVPEDAAGFRSEAEAAVFPFAWAAFPAGALDGFFLFNEFIELLSLSSLAAQRWLVSGDVDPHTNKLVITFGK
jgi:hypothetical protein